MVTRWERVGERIVLAERFGKRLVRQDFRNPVSGAMEEFALLERPDWVTVLAVTGDCNNSGDVIAIREYMQGGDTVLLHLPAGGIDGYETIEDTARRELREETGYEPQRIVDLGFHWMEPRNSPTRGHAVLAVGCRRVTEPNADPGEPIDVMLVSFPEWLRLILGGTIEAPTATVATIRALEHLGYHIAEH